MKRRTRDQFRRVGSDVAVDEHMRNTHRLELRFIPRYIVGSQVEPLGDLLRAMSHVVSVSSGMLH